MTEDILNSSSQGTSSSRAQSQCTANRQMDKATGCTQNEKSRGWHKQNTHSKIRMSPNQEHQKLSTANVLGVSPCNAGLKKKKKSSFRKAAPFFLLVFSSLAQVNKSKISTEILLWDP